VMKRVLKFTVIGWILLNVVISGVGIALRFFVKVREDPEDDDVSLPAVFGSRDFVSEATSLNYVRVVIYCGGVRMDLSSAQIAPQGLEIKATKIMGGIDIIVPTGCRVDLRPTTVMGGTIAPTPEEDLPDDAPEITVRCMTLMGGLKVR